jgi:hypothetical protein
MSASVDIAQGRDDPAETCNLFSCFLPDAESSVAEATYRALRMFTLELLDRKRVGPELMRRRAVIDEAIRMLAARHPEQATKLSVLADLISDSCSMIASLPDPASYFSGNVATFIFSISSLGGTASIPEMEKAVLFDPRCIPQILMTALAAGFVTRQGIGNEASFTITEFGSRSLSKYEAEKTLLES